MDDKMKINEEKFMNFLNEKWKNKICQLCGNNNWSVSNKVFELREFNRGSLIIGGNNAIFPIMVVSCTECGNSIMINAITSGAIDKNNESEDGK